MTSRIWVAALAAGLSALGFVLAAPPREGDRPPGPGGREGGPPPFKLGAILPPHVRDNIELSPQQQKELEAIEAEVKAKLEKILTADQRKKAETLRPMPPPPPGGRDGDRPPPPREGDRPRPGAERPRDGDGPPRPGPGGRDGDRPPPPRDGDRPGPGPRDGDRPMPPPGDRPGRPGGREGRDGPPPPRLVEVLPPHVRDGLDLNDDQRKAIDSLEADTKAKFEKLLTPEQRRKIESARPMPPPPPPGGPRPGRD